MASGYPCIISPHACRGIYDEVDMNLLEFVSQSLDSDASVNFVLITVMLDPVTNKSSLTGSLELEVLLPINGKAGTTGICSPFGGKMLIDP